MKNSTFGSKWLLALGAISVVGLAIIALLSLRAPKTPEQIALAAQRMIIEGDGAGIWALISEDEIADLNLTEQAVEQYVESFVAGRIRGFSAVGEAKVDRSASDRSISVTQQLQHGDGRSFLLMTQASPAGDQDAKVTAFIANTYLSVCYADLPPGKSSPGGMEKRRFWIEKAEEYGPILDKLGVSGFKNVANKIYTWNEWIAINKSAIR